MRVSALTLTVLKQCQLCSHRLSVLFLPVLPSALEPHALPHLLRSPSPSPPGAAGSAVLCHAPRRPAPEPFQEEDPFQKVNLTESRHKHEHGMPEVQLRNHGNEQSK